VSEGITPFDLNFSSGLDEWSTSRHVHFTSLGERVAGHFGKERFHVTAGIRTFDRPDRGLVAVATVLFRIILINNNYLSYCINFYIVNVR